MEKNNKKNYPTFYDSIRLKKRRKRFYHYKSFKRDMTYILGARCKDGVVLVGDTKVTVDGGADFAYSKKITAPLTNVIMGSAGIGGLYKEFQNRVVSAVVQMEKNRVEEGHDYIFPIITTEEEFSVLVSKIIREMHEDYGEDRYLLHSQLMILCASRISGPIAQLTTFTGYGFPEPVNQFRAIGHGEPYGSIFLKKMWKQNMTMEEVTKLGLFIIKFIDEMQLDKSVGYNREFLPQVFHIPDVEIPDELLVIESITSKEQMLELQEKYQPHYEKFPIYEINHEEVSHYLNEISSKISDFNNLFIKGQFKL